MTIFSTSPVERRRLAVVTLSVVIALAGVVLVVRAALPVIPGWVFPTALGSVTVGLIVWGRLLARRGRTPGARAVAGWAGVTASIGISAGASLASIGGGLVVILVIVLAVNVVLALWFRSAVHFAVAQWLGFVWAVIAYVYEVAPVAGLVVAAAGLWWLSAVGFSRVVVVTTTAVLPVMSALALHPLTHAGLAIDGADVATAAGLTGLAVLLGARLTGKTADERVWPVMRSVIVILLLAQIVLGGVPAVSALLAPERPWPGLLVGLAALALALSVAVVSRLRPGTVRALELASLLWCVVFASVLFGASAGSLVACLAIAGPVVVDLVLGRVRPSGVLPRLGAVAAAGVGFLVVVPLPLPGVVAVLLGLSGVVAFLGLSMRSMSEVQR